MNGVTVADETLSSPTGGDNGDKQVSMLIGTAALKCGPNELRVEPLSLSRALQRIAEIGFIP